MKSYTLYNTIYSNERVDATSLMNEYNFDSLSALFSTIARLKVKYANHADIDVALLLEIDMGGYDAEAILRSNYDIAASLVDVNDEQRAKFLRIAEKRQATALRNMRLRKLQNLV